MIKESKNTKLKRELKDWGLAFIFCATLLTLALI